MHHLYQVLRIAVQTDLALLLERSECRDCCQHFHPIVGRLTVTSRQLTAMRSIAQHDAITARARVTEASAIRIGVNVPQILHVISNL